MAITMTASAIETKLQHNTKFDQIIFKDTAHPF